MKVTSIDTKFINYEIFVMLPVSQISHQLYKKSLINGKYKITIILVNLKIHTILQWPHGYLKTTKIYIIIKKNFNCFENINGF